jgi:hypothetical protein
MIRTLGTLWVLDYKDNGQARPQVRIGTVSGPSLAQALAQVLETTMAPSSKTLCQQCSAETKPEDRFCSHCGTEIREGI